MIKNLVFLSLILFAFVAYSHQQYKEEVAKELVLGSMVSYCPAGSLRNMDCGVNCDNINLF